MNMYVPIYLFYSFVQINPNPNLNNPAKISHIGMQPDLHCKTGCLLITGNPLFLFYWNRLTFFPNNES